MIFHENLSNETKIAAQFFQLNMYMLMFCVLDREEESLKLKLNLRSFLEYPMSGQLSQSWQSWTEEMMLIQ